MTEAPERDKKDLRPGLGRAINILLVLVLLALLALLFLSYSMSEPA